MDVTGSLEVTEVLACSETLVSEVLTLLRHSGGGEGPHFCR